MKSAIEAFEREFAPWALRLPAADVAARRNGQLRANGWSVLYEFGSDTFGEYLDYYAALREATDARVNDDWHARIYETGQVLAFPAVLEAYLYGRDPSADELLRARAPVLASLEPSAEQGDIGSADTALWEDLKDVVEAETPAEPAPAPPPAPPRRSSETPAEIANVLDAAFGGAKEDEEPAEDTPVEEEDAPVDEEDVPVEEIVSAAPRRSAPGYDPFVELRTLEPKSKHHAPPTSDDFRPYWQRYPVRVGGIAAGVMAVLLVTILMMSHGKSSPRASRTLADTSTTAAQPSTDSAAAPAPAQSDSQTVAEPAPDAPDTASTPAPAPTVAPASSQSEDNSVAKPFGPGSVPKIQRAQ